MQDIKAYYLRNTAIPGIILTSNMILKVPYSALFTSLVKETKKAKCMPTLSHKLDLNTFISSVRQDALSI